MKRLFPFAFVLWLMALAVSTPHAQGAPPTASVVVPPAAPDPKNPETLFSPSENCVACHNALTTPDGEDVSIGASWRSTIMANSARDPYWQAGLRRETIDHPMHAEDIQHECAACHMPMLQKVALAKGNKANVFAQLPINKDDDSNLHTLAADGVSCTVCHQISNEGLGTRPNFNANFTMRPTPPDKHRVIFGPFQIDQGRKTIMRSATGFQQMKTDHIQQSELCATCHTLYTQAIAPDGRIIGSLPEQMNFQEWQHSDYSNQQTGRSCQSCHMPIVTEPTRAASVFGDYRDNVHRHVFVGGNAFMVRLLNRYRDELGVTASSSELEATAKATVNQLQRDTATITVANTTTSGTTVSADVTVTNVTGHKFPTGYPSRRTWIHFTVRDRDGRPVFESGAAASSGLIEGNDNDADATKYEPHYDEITRPDQVQIYESVLGDTNNVPTTGLLTATHYLKDNRLLPRGFDKMTADADIGVYGNAMQDPNFASSGDRVHYSVAVPAGAGPFTITAELLYQPIGYRWAHNLEKYDAPEPKRFVGYYNALSGSSWVAVARAVLTTQP